MSTAPSKLIIDCEQSLLSYSFSEYLPLFASFVKEHLIPMSPSESILPIFDKEYGDKTLTLKTVIRFFKEKQDMLLWWLMVEDEVSDKVLNHVEELNLKKFIALKDPKLQRGIISRYAESTLPIIIITTCPYTQLVTDCLTIVLPKISFEVLYAPSQDKNRKSTNRSTISRSLSEYFVLIDYTKPPPKDGWENYERELRQRLLNLDLSISNAPDAFFYAKKESIVIKQEEVLSSETPPSTQNPALCHPIPTYWRHIKKKTLGDIERRTPSPAQRLVNSGEAHPGTPPRPK